MPRRGTTRWGRDRRFTVSEAGARRLEHSPGECVAGRHACNSCKERRPSQTAKLPMEKIQGFRAPYLSFTPEQRAILSNNGFRFASRGWSRGS